MCIRDRSQAFAWRLAARPAGAVSRSSNTHCYFQKCLEQGILIGSRLIPIAVLEAVDEAVCVHQGAKSWLGRPGGDLVLLPAGGDICTTSKPAAGGESPVSVGRCCGDACVRRAANTR